MPCAYRDKKGWIAEYIPLRETKRRRQRVPADRLAGEDPRELARAYAEDCERACRRLEGVYVADDVRRALALRAITQAQHDALLQFRPAPTRDSAEPLTLEAAAMMHPSTQRQKAADRWRYIDHLAKFCAWAKVKNVKDVTLTMVQDYVQHLQADGYAWDTRRHMLLYVRRATRMATTVGLPDVLGELVLDRQGRRAQLQAWTLDDLALALVRLKGDLRASAAVAMGGLLGMRPSECCRVRPGDLTKDNLLAIGVADGRAAKNEASRRYLPTPPSVASIIRALEDGAPAGEPLLRTYSGGDGIDSRARPFDPAAFAHWLVPKLAEVTGRRLPVKCLRKSFATWMTRARMDRDHVEMYLGHATELSAGVTGKHYLADVQRLLAEQLRPTAKAMEPLIAKALKRARRLHRLPTSDVSSRAG